MTANPEPQLAAFEDMVRENKALVTREGRKREALSETKPVISSSLLIYSEEVQFTYETDADLLDMFNSIMCSGTVPFVSFLHGRQFIKLHDSTLSYDDVAPLLFDQKNKMELDAKRAGRKAPTIILLYNHGGSKDSTVPSMASVTIRGSPLTVNVNISQSFTERHRNVNARTILANIKTRKDSYSFTSPKTQEEVSVTYVFGVPDKTYSEDVLVHLVTFDSVLSPFFTASEVTSGAMNTSNSKVVPPVFLYMGGTKPVSFKIRKGDLIHEAEEGQEAFSPDTMFTTFVIEAPNFDMVKAAHRDIRRLLARYDTLKDTVPKLYPDSMHAMQAKIDRKLGRAHQAVPGFIARNAMLPPQIFRAPPKRNSKMTYARACQNPPRIVPQPPEGYDEDKYLLFPEVETAGVQPQWYSCDHYAKDYVDPNAPKKKPKAAPKPKKAAPPPPAVETEPQPEKAQPKPKAQPKAKKADAQAGDRIVLSNGGRTAFDPVTGLTFNVEDVAADGNCFFRAVALAEEDEEPDAHLRYRKEIVEGIIDLQQNDINAMQVLVPDVEQKEYNFQTLLTPGVWNVEEMDYVPAFAGRIIDRTVIIYSANNPTIVSEVPGTDPIYLLYVNRNHYKVLHPM